MSKKEFSTVVMLAKERHGEHKKSSKKSIYTYSSNRNKIRVNLVKQQLVNRKLRVQWYNDYPSTTQVVSHMIVSRRSGQLYLSSAPQTGGVWHKAFLRSVRAQDYSSYAPGILKNTSGRPPEARDISSADVHPTWTAQLTTRPAEVWPNNWRGVPNTWIWPTGVCHAPDWTRPF